MDPDTTMSKLFEHLASGEWGDAGEKAQFLLDWLARGGFPPGGGRFRRSSLTAFLNWVIKQQPEEDVL